MKQDFNTNGDPYYKYMLCYVHDFLHMGFKPKDDSYALNFISRLKQGFGTPDLYLGENIDKVHLEDGFIIWYTKCVDSLNISIDNFNNFLGVDKAALKNYDDCNRS